METSLRTHTCGELRIQDLNKEVVLCGWIKRLRTHGKVTFIDLYDRYGITQVVIDKEITLPRESVIQVKGIVKERLEKNEKIETGQIEVHCTELKVLNEAERIPIDLEDFNQTNEDMRLRYRYLDLRRKKMQENLLLRYKITKITRDYFDKLNFIEIETPLLSKSTPEGARDYLVPSRLYPGKFYALPQSPQQYKQLLMIAGFDRYFQIAKCLRDEDLRADRQPEFTQIDVEMSFIEEKDIQDVIEGLMKEILKLKNYDLNLPLRRIKYVDAMNDYGSDKPDLRFKLKIQDFTEIFRKSSYEIFKKVIENGGVVKGLRIPHGSKMTRKQLDELERIAKENGAKGLSYAKVDEEISGTIAKFWNELKIEHEKGDLFLFIADKWKIACEAMGKVRLKIFDIIKEDKELFEKYKNMNLFGEEFELLWVVDFPLFSWSEEEKRFVSEHHPFTSPKNEFIEELINNKEKWMDKLDQITAKSYDIVMNGYEIGGGSIRIFNPKLQKIIFEILGLSEEEIKKKFGNFIEAFRYGAPPHGGIALGLDRIAAILAGESNIREVIAFPKNKNAVGLLEDTPSEVSPEQLKELHIKIEDQ
ncbi:MAG: aspartate--tRNA ligase [Candidatus Woesearchaeota archaeon]